MYKTVQINYCRKVFCAIAYPCVLTSAPLTYVWAFGFVGCILFFGHSNPNWRTQKCFRGVGIPPIRQVHLMWLTVPGVIKHGCRSLIYWLVLLKASYDSPIYFGEMGNFPWTCFITGGVLLLLLPWWLGDSTPFGLHSRCIHNMFHHILSPFFAGKLQNMYISWMSWTSEVPKEI